MMLASRLDVNQHQLAFVADRRWGDPKAAP
jgi:hypothetical protein